MAQNKTFVTETIVAGGLTKSYAVTDNIEIYNLTPSGGTVALAGDVLITSSGSLTAGTTYTFKVAAGFTLGANTFSIMGTALTAAQCLYETMVHCYYTGSTWEVHVCADEQSGNTNIDGARIQALSIPTAAYAAKSVTTAKMADLPAKGYTYLGGNNGVVNSVNISTDKVVLIGDGTTANPVVITGDITIANTGAATIGAGKVTAAMLAYTPVEYFETSLSLTSAQILTLYTVPITIVPSPGANKYIEVISASISTTFLTSAYATNTTVILKNTGADISQFSNTPCLVATVSKTTNMIPTTAVAGIGETQILANTALQVSVKVGDPTAGLGSIKVRVIYAIRIV